VSTPRERFTVVVEALPNQTPSRIRIIRFLKRALRSFGIKCISIAPAASQGTTAAAEANSALPDGGGRATSDPGAF
jgi:hypothetical protein